MNVIGDTNGPQILTTYFPSSPLIRTEDEISEYNLQQAVEVILNVYKIPIKKLFRWFEYIVFVSWPYLVSILWDSFEKDEFKVCEIKSINWRARGHHSHFMRGWNRISIARHRPHNVFRYMRRGLCYTHTRAHGHTARQEKPFDTAHLVAHNNDNNFCVDWQIDAAVRTARGAREKKRKKYIHIFKVPVKW